ncbi:MAG: hypothetical protein ACXWOL_03490 [Ktedonobacteraceae bacterium]
MNINSGGPHILLFERDQQLTTLLTSEFQLAGYECHPARTAVEVFDAIARNPIRLVLVNLAQPAASRREFWVALDTQRRGRGVQVLTFRCTNIAGYGSDDSEESTRTVLTDIEVDGMMGIMNLVDAVRSRIPGPITGSFSQIAGSNRQETSSQATASLSMQSTNPSLATPSRSNSTAIPSDKSSGTNRIGNPASGFTDKIRAVIYPSSRNFSPTPETSRISQNDQNQVLTQQTIGSQDSQIRQQDVQDSRVNTAQRLNNEVNVQSETPQNISSAPQNSSRTAVRQVQESGLDQLSRMVHNSLLTETDDSSDQGILRRPTSPLAEPIEQKAQNQTHEMNNNDVNSQTQSAVLQQSQPTDANAISALPLRASPIEDIPIEREQEYRSTYAGIQSLQMESIVQEVPTISTSSPVSQSALRTNFEREEEMSPAIADMQSIEEDDYPMKVGEEDAIARALAEIPSLSLKKTQNQPPSKDATSDDLLLNIVQSLPPMSSLPTPQTQHSTPVLSGRATRSLGSVLLEGHLVPQHRLEVAQHVQRMLRGVDMNYQLGEILLMFKLLTPDQLLAASLVSYGLISTAQISALGRIRQELHSIGLEYDLESLLVLFRILTPEQLREVRASWIG